jgi:L-threonylcarbamoyladenylate synthase
MVFCTIEEDILSSSMRTIRFSSENFLYVSRYLRSGRIAILPTDTLPGFSVDPENQRGVSSLSHLKGRPPKKPFLLLLPNIEMAQSVCQFSLLTQKIAARFWPGPLTLLLPRRLGALPHFFPAEDELAIRIPGEKEVINFLRIFERPIVSTSINVSGCPPLISRGEILSVFGKQNILFAFSEESKTRKALASSIVRIQGEHISFVREGAIRKNNILGMKFGLEGN